MVKKNQSRLRSLRNWLRDIPEPIRRRVPVLLLDDEADQATPSSAAAREQLTRINQLVRQIWAEIPTGTYVGYTATPFANIFMDPNDEEELYPADFIIDLPRPDAYFGAERVFGREPLDDADDPDPGPRHGARCPGRRCRVAQTAEQEGHQGELRSRTPRLLDRRGDLVPRRHGHPPGARPAGRAQLHARPYHALRRTTLRDERAPQRPAGGVPCQLGAREPLPVPYLV